MRKTIIILITLLTGVFANAQTWDIGAPNDADVTATLSGNTLAISGTGAMQDFLNYNENPWYAFRNLINAVVIEDGVKSIGDGAFWGLQ